MTDRPDGFLKDVPLRMALAAALMSATLLPAFFASCRDGRCAKAGNNAAKADRNRKEKAEEPAAGPRYEILVGDRKAYVELAANEEEWRRGLMFRKSLPPDAGMLFVYPDDRILSFWMKNTYVPLSVAFARADGTIIKIADMRPLTTESHRSPIECRYALEMPLGWFEANGITAGARMQIPEQMLKDARARFIGEPVERKTLQN